MASIMLANCLSSRDVLLESQSIKFMRSLTTKFFVCSKTRFSSLLAHTVKSASWDDKKSPSLHHIILDGVTKPTITFFDMRISCSPELRYYAAGLISLYK